MTLTPYFMQIEKQICLWRFVVYIQNVLSGVFKQTSAFHLGFAANCNGKISAEWPNWD